MLDEGTTEWHFTELPMAHRRGRKPRTRGDSAIMIALVVALGAHGVVLGALRFARYRERAPAVARTAARSRDVEVELLKDEPAQPVAREAVRQRHERVHVITTSRTRTRETVIAESTSPAEPLAAPVEASTVSPAPGSTGDTVRRPIDLGLEGGLTRMTLLEHRFDRPEREPAPSIGLLSEGLAEMDAAHGVSRSGLALHAGYEAARAFAPAQGIALFDVQADAMGSVVSISLVSSGPDEERWRRVGERMRALLSGKRLRVAPGARGLLARLRIEHGEHAQSKEDRERIVERRPALGQGPLPPRAIANESTHRSLENGQLTPVFVLYSSESVAKPLRVALVSERAL
jgi:hypothetical protein